MANGKPKLSSWLRLHVSYKNPNQLVQVTEFDWVTYGHCLSRSRTEGCLFIDLCYRL